MSLSSIVSPGQLRAMAELARSAPPGDFAEVGVYNGGSAEVLYNVTEQQGRTLHLFDTFCGTPVFSPGLDQHQLGEFVPQDGIELRIREALPNAKLYVGTYPQTHPDNLPALAFTHCDCDQYLSYLAVIQNMWSLTVSGGILYFDDYPYLEGAKRAVEENFAPQVLKLCDRRYYVVKP